MAKKKKAVELELMTKKSIAKKISAVHDITQIKANEIVNHVFDEITKQLTGGGNVRIDTFGMFKAVQRAARTGRNPFTGENIEVPAKMAVTFKPSTALKEGMN